MTAIIIIFKIGKMPRFHLKGFRLFLSYQMSAGAIPHFLFLIITRWITFENHWHALNCIRHIVILHFHVEPTNPSSKNFSLILHIIQHILLQHSTYLHLQSIRSIKKHSRNQIIYYDWFLDEEKEKLQHIHINHFSLSCEIEKLYLWMRCELWIEPTWMPRSVFTYMKPLVTFNGRTLRNNFAMIQTNCQHFPEPHC